VLGGSSPEGWFTWGCSASSPQLDRFYASCSVSEGRKLAGENGFANFAYILRDLADVFSCGLFLVIRVRRSQKTRKTRLAFIEMM
jgi:hypothetical protein